MSRRKNKKFLLNKEETKEFLALLKKNKIRLKNIANDFCVTYPTVHYAVKHLIVPKCWLELVEQRLKIKNLEQQLEKIREGLKCLE